MKVTSPAYPALTEWAQTNIKKVMTLRKNY